MTEERHYNMGVNHPFYGKRHSEQSKEKMKQAKLGKKRGPLSEEIKEKIRQTRLGSKNWRWKGDHVSYRSLHEWVRKYLSEPKLCEICKKVPPKHLSNKTGVYNRELKNWWYLCVRCHCIYDGINNLPKRKPLDMSGRICSNCNTDKTHIDSRNNRPMWFYLDGELVCRRCYVNEYNRRKRLEKSL